MHPLLTQLHYTDVEAAREPVLEALRRIDHAGGTGWSDDRSPFPGLLAFDAGLHRAFFGRNDDIDRLAGALRSPEERADNAVLLVVGPSGCGKSSLVRAGLVPRIADEPEWWTLPVFKPGEDPQAMLVRELAGAFRDLGRERPIDDVEKALERGAVFDELLLAVPGKRRRGLLVVIDQAEELLTQTKDPVARLVQDTDSGGRPAAAGLHAGAAGEGRAARGRAVGRPVRGAGRGAGRVDPAGRGGARADRTQPRGRAEGVAAARDGGRAGQADAVAQRADAGAGRVRAATTADGRHRERRGQGQRVAREVLHGVAAAAAGDRKGRRRPAGPARGRTGRRRVADRPAQGRRPLGTPSARLRPCRRGDRAEPARP